MTLLLIRIGIVLLCLIGAAVEFLLPYLRSNGMGLARRRLRGQREVVDEENSGDDFDVCEAGSAAGVREGGVRVAAKADSQRE